LIFLFFKGASNMPLTVSQVVTRFALTSALISTLMTTSWAMEEASVFNAPLEIATPIVQKLSKTHRPHAFRAGELQEVTDWEALNTFRQTSKLWKQAADDVIVEEGLLSIRLRPDNYRDKELIGLAPLTTTIFLVGWNAGNAHDIERTFKYHTFDSSFKNVVAIRCTRSGDSTLVSNDIGEQGIITLAAALKSFPDLKTLNIEQMTIGVQGGEALGKVLPSLPELRYISLNSGKMGPEGTWKFVEGLDHKHLKKLNLGGNGIGDLGCTLLAQKIKTLPALSDLYLDNTIYGNTPDAESGKIGKTAEKYLKNAINTYNPNLSFRINK
jgi:hypothetical protein